MPSDLVDRIVATTRPKTEIVVRPVRRIFGVDRSTWRIAASLTVLLGGASLAGWLALRSPLSTPTHEVASNDAALVGTVWAAVDLAWEDEAWRRSALALDELDALRASLDAVERSSWKPADVLDAAWISDSL